MKNDYIICTIFLLLFSTTFYSQIGINTTSPNATVDIRSSNQVTPTNTDGILIPKIDNFPVTNPTAAQNAMMVYLTTSVGSNTPGFYFWNNATTTWEKVNGNGSTLDQAYDFGGAGNGRIITADAGSVEINGTDGFVVNGILNGGAFSPAGAGVKMFFNPRKAAFRAGSITGTQWDNALLGDYSFATGLNNIASTFAASTGENNTASGAYSIALGRNNTASEAYSMALGFQNDSSGNASFAAGLNNNASGKNAVTIGRSNTATGAESVAIGLSMLARSWSEVSLGSHNLDYTPNSATSFNLLDRIFTIGNGVDEVNRSNALTILKNANTIIGGANPNARLEIAPSNAATPANTDGIIIPRINSFPATNPTAAQNAMMVYLTTTVGTNTPGFYFWNNATSTWTRVDRGGTLDQAYDFGGAGNGRIINADAGAVTINGNDGLVVNGNIGIGTTIRNAPFQFSNSTQNRKISLFETANNDHQFYGLGVNAGSLRYQVDDTSSNHIFFAGSSTSTSNELFRIRGNGNVAVAGIVENEVLISPAALFNAWVNFGAPYANVQYYKDKENRVHLKGLIRSGTLNSVMFILPVGYRPANRLIFSVVADNGFGRLDVFVNGSVSLVSGSNAFVSLDGVSFRAEQ